MFPRKNMPTLLAAIAAVAVSIPANAADHLDAPALRTNANAASDINDLYAFQSPNDPNSTVLILTVNPLAGLQNPFGSTSGLTFDSAVNYEFNIDNDGDAVADVTYTTTFSPAAPNGTQAFSVDRNGTAYAAGSTPVLGGTASTAVSTTGGMVAAGLYDDPFFFDFFGFLDNLNFTGDDTFAGTNVSAIVLEVPSSELNGATSNIGVWARTADTATNTQVDRMGRPGINTVLISTDKDAFNQQVPQDNPGNPFTGEIQAAIESLNGGDTTHSAAVTDILLPDILTFNTASTDGYDLGDINPSQLNGRKLTDDVIDTSLTVLTNSSSPIGDGVDANDQPFLGVFPYLAPANQIPEPASLALMGFGLAALGYARRRKVS